ncbi:SGNH/GDSL hydrolase family protein [Leeuwenhoekiella parthenopeia]|uniref:SGNH/GDSL hydrolase family protein n=1 Tax=Leeuwenhoekiella parthenopeia TaxID=2890320 RepID=A0ABS8GPN1_9FLAO|nr:SGNH/GDSL hydrolase family protein [Leeuwenhoekiella parthenopeia]MCC4211645.1 SGNH/GDSL hydrolase family protein [Leeuwenhoekiella parthenopeia]
MKTWVQILFAAFLCVGCAAGDDVSGFEPQTETPAETPASPNPDTELSGTYNYLALGDSYTIGESVCETCNYPMQLKTAFKNETQADLSVKIIARTGWRTESLIQAIKGENPAQNQDLVTLLIGVNNQYQGGSLETYKIQFKELLETAVKLAKGDRDRVVVLSIPDYAFTPFGQSTTNPEEITAEINAFNEAAENIATSSDVSFLNITDITRKGIEDPELVALDALHPSEKAYAKFVERLLPIALEILKTN